MIPYNERPFYIFYLRCNCEKMCYSPFSSQALMLAEQAFEESELPILKEEKPGLTHTQYKDMLWKLWKKSPDNPLNQDK